MRLSNQLVVFLLDEQRYALHLPVVERVVRAVEVTPLPKAPAIVLGVMNVQGRIIPVVNIRQRFRLPERDIGLSDQLIIAHTAKRPVALAADAVTGVVEISEQYIVSRETILPGLGYMTGAVKLDDGLVLIHDLDTFLSLDEEKALDEALQADR